MNFRCLIAESTVSAILFCPASSAFLGGTGEVSLSEQATATRQLSNSRLPLEDALSAVSAGKPRQSHHEQAMVKGWTK